MPYGIVGWVVAGVVGLLVLVYVGLPLLIRANMVFRIDPANLSEITREDLPEDAAEWTQNTEEELAEVGFLPVGGYVLRGMVPDVDSVFFLYACPERRTLAMDAFIQTKANPDAGTPVNTKRYVEFSTKLADGRELNTSNHSEPDPPDALPENVSRRYPGENDLSRLHRLHEACLKHEFADSKRQPLPADRPWEEVFLEDLIDEMDRKCDRGFWQRDGAAYRLSLVGAMRCTWAELPPFKGPRHRRLFDQAERWRAEYGIG